MNAKSLAAATLALFSMASNCFAIEELERVGSAYPSPSPDGSQMVFQANFDGVSRIWLVKTDGKDLRRLSLRTASDAVVELSPSLSPDGRSIAYESAEDGRSSIWIMDSDGRNARPLTSSAQNNSSPSWSPDGRSIAFVSDRDGSNDIWMMNADGSNQRKVFDSPDQENTPTFSPSGAQIVFSRFDSIGGSRIMTVNTNGSGAQLLTSPSFEDWSPSWGSQGIVFSSNRDAGNVSRVLWIVQPDGTGLRKLPNSNGSDPVWMSNGKIAMTGDMSNSKAESTLMIYSLSTAEARPVIDIQGFLTPIDIRPGKSPNRIFHMSAGRPEVAILSTRDFDATKKVDRSTIRIGRTGSEASLRSCLPKARDVNGDGLPDLVCRFSMRLANFQPGDTEGMLRFDEIRESVNSAARHREGRDSIMIVPDEDPDDFKD